MKKIELSILDIVYIKNYSNPMSFSVESYTKKGNIAFVVEPSKETIAKATSSDGNKSHIIVVIDRSGSMNDTICKSKYQAPMLQRRNGLVPTDRNRVLRSNSEPRPINGGIDYVGTEVSNDFDYADEFEQTNPTFSKSEIVASCLIQIQKHLSRNPDADMLSCVTFDTTIETPIVRKYMTVDNMQTYDRKFITHMLSPRGATDIYSGLKLAVNIFDETLELYPGINQKIIVLSDGEHNATNIISRDQFLELFDQVETVQEKKSIFTSLSSSPTKLSKGITLTKNKYTYQNLHIYREIIVTIGIGDADSDYDAVLLGAMTINTAEAKTTQKAVEFLLSAALNTCYMVTKNLKMQFPPEVNVLTSLVHEVTEKGTTVECGDVDFSQIFPVVLEVAEGTKSTAFDLIYLTSDDAVSTQTMYLNFAEDNQVEYDRIDTFNKMNTDFVKAFKYTVNATHISKVKEVLDALQLWKNEYRQNHKLEHLWGGLEKAVINHYNEITRTSFLGMNTEYMRTASSGADRQCSNMKSAYTSVRSAEKYVSMDGDDIMRTTSGMPSKKKTVGKSRLTNSVVVDL